MGAGNALIGVALASSIGSFISFLLARAGNEKLRAAARLLYWAASICVFAMSMLLVAMMLGDRFDVKYVHDFSSKSQMLIYKISGFWGGQEGSWLLWLAWISAIGLLLLRRVGPGHSETMAFWASLQTFFLVVLASESPFVPTGQPVQDGMGLNPLLQNYWMAIHPPILFCGFTLMCVPAAFAFSALVRGESETWVRTAFGWAVAGFTILGVGILLGGVWAYETLGWGGFWGWDPVENASLVPWLIGGGLVHGLMLERTKGSWKRLNLLLAIAAFLLVIYATFLTRSGVLGEFSVHSFAALGSSNWLLGFLLGYLVIGLGLVAYRSLASSAFPEPERISGKEIIVFLGVLVFGAAAILVALGMSSPLLSKLLAGRAGNVPIDYYYRVMTPVAAAVLALVGLAPLVVWSRRARNETTPGTIWLKLYAASLGTGLAVAVYVLLTKGEWSAARLLVGWFAAAATVPNIWALAACVRTRGWAPSGGHLAHVGLCIFFAGMLLSSQNNKPNPDRLSLEPNTPIPHLGMTWTLLGMGQRSATGKQPFRIMVQQRDGKAFLAQPMIQETRDGSEMKHPFIRRSLLGDLYIAPVDTEFSNLPPHGKATTKGWSQLGPWEVKLLGFSDMQMRPDGGVRAGARLLVRLDGQEQQRQLTSGLEMGPNGTSYHPASLPGSEDVLAITDMSVASKEVTVVLDGPKWRQHLTSHAIVEVTHKPFVWMAWLGAAVIAAGGGISSLRRFRDGRRLAGQETLVDQINEIEKDLPDLDPREELTT